MKNFCELFLCSSKELKNVRNLVMASLLMTISIVLNFFTVPITQFMRLSLGFLAAAMISMLFGPVVGGMCGGLSDIINYIITPNGPYFPGFTLSGIIGGVFYGLALYNKKITIIRCIVVTIITTVLIDILLNTFWLYLMYGKSFFLLLPPRAIKDLAIIPIKIGMLYFILRLGSRMRNI